MSFSEKNYYENLSPAQKALHFIWDLLKVIVVSLLIIFPIRYWIIQPFYVKGASMEPSFYDHEYLIINEFIYRFQEPERGDIIIFKYPKDPSQYFIKRIIGLPGEKVEIIDNHVYIYQSDTKNKFMLDENPYLDSQSVTSGNRIWQLGPTDYYVLGDNRDFSLDSRSFGPVELDLIIGKVWLRGWPVWRATIFSDVAYNIAN